MVGGGVSAWRCSFVVGNTMARYAGPEDVYDEVTRAHDAHWLGGLLAFAVIEEQKIEWMKHHAEHCGCSVTDEQVTAWYGALPETALVRARKAAQDSLDTYADDVAAAVGDALRKEVEQSLLLGEIRQVRRFWPQFGLSIAGGLASSILFGALLFFIAFLVLNERSPIAIGASLQPSAAEEVNSHE